jgi:CHAT domain-containing protein
MTPQELVEKLLTLPDAEAQRRFLKDHTSLLDDQVAEALKAQADHFLRSDLNRALQTAVLLQSLAQFSNNPLHRALGLLAEAHARSFGGLGEYERAIQLYEEAAAIYRVHNLPVNEARTHIGKIWSLACLGRYAEAIEVGQEGSDVLESHAAWRPLAKLTMNLAVVHGRQGDDTSALAMLDRARKLHRQLDGEESSVLPLIEQNRAIVLRNLGRFEESMAASQEAEEALTRLGHTVEAARAQQNLAITYFVLAQYNEALKLLNETRDIFLADGRQRDAILVDLFISDCLLQLRRFPDVLSKCREVRDLFSELGTRFEVGQTVLNEAVAYAGLRQYQEAMASLAEARQHFHDEGNDVWVATTDLEQATILLRQGEFDASRTAIEASARVFRDHDLPLKEAQARLIAARVATAQAHIDQAVDMVHQAMDVGSGKGIPSLTYECHHLLGYMAQEQGDLQVALVEYEQAILDLERLRGRLMIEHRVEFLEDKQVVYEDAVALCLEMDQPARGLEFAERAKSRALLDLLAYRLDLSVRARNRGDEPLVRQLEQLRAERDRIYRRWETEEEIPVRGGWQQVQQEVLALEQQITELWHKLLIRNGDYARDAALWHVRTESAQPYLDGETLLIEYFVAHRKLIAFLITEDAVQAHYLLADLGRVQQLERLLRLNLGTVPKSHPSQLRGLSRNACSLLQQLYDALLVPLQNELASRKRLIIVPHGLLHYLPFHALHDGQAYLLEHHEISYLPGASVLRYCRETQSASKGLAAFGYSFEGRLPHAVHEARTIADYLGGEAFLEDEVTSAQLRKAVSDCRLLHLATHGDFRPDNPLFSGLALSDGWLTTLDIFNLRLNTSLVTLSACQTGRNVVSGGDELMGLMRAFLYAGTASLALSLWPVEDRSTAQIMETFYRRLADGWTKGAALQFAQQRAIQGSYEGDMPEAYTHPYYWAPFFLVGDPGFL